jgi:hypothetical protein
MMRFGWLIILFFICGSLRAQRFVERIYLKDSIGYYEGHVVEQSPGNYIKLFRPRQGDTLVVAMARVLSMSKHFQRLPRGSVRWIDREKLYYKAVYAEMVGRALMYSINFDMRAERGSQKGWGFSVGYSRLGLALVTDNGRDLRYHPMNLVPVSINYLLGKNKHFMELGGGATFMLGGLRNYQLEEYVFADDAIPAKGMFGHFIVGYRYVPPINGIMLRLTATPLFGSNGGIHFWGGLSIGYQFW